MPIIKSAKKALRSSLRKREGNIERKDDLKRSLKDFKKVPTPEALSKAYQALDKAAKKGIIKKNTASRKKSRLATLLKKNAL